MHLLLESSDIYYSKRKKTQINQQSTRFLFIQFISIKVCGYLTIVSNHHIYIIISRVAVFTTAYHVFSAVSPSILNWMVTWMSSSSANMLVHKLFIRDNIYSVCEYEVTIYTFNTCVQFVQFLLGLMARTSYCYQNQFAAVFLLHYNENHAHIGNSMPSKQRIEFLFRHRLDMSGISGYWADRTDLQK